MAASTPKRFDFVAGNAALDFANTLGGLRGGVTNEHLADGYADLAAWTGQAGLLDAETLRGLAHAAAQKPATATRAFARAVAGREAVYAVFSAAAAGRPPPAGALETINRELPLALGRMQVKFTKDRFAWELPVDDNALDLPLWTVMREAAELLTSDQLRHVRECAGETCSWLFLDNTKNHSRLWCSMSDCGNRAKVQRHRARHA